MDYQDFLKQKFRDYYRKNFVKGPPSIAQREFGVGEFGKKITARHLGFANSTPLNEYLRKETPLFISYSNAYYKSPEKRPMEAKEFLKADLVYEFDADDLKTECKEKHDSWRCKCGASGKGAIEACTKCGRRVEVEQWVCLECLDAVKKQVFRLIDFLEKDFGFSEGIHINFSGSKGYHIHVRDELIANLSNNARVELVDYLTAHELSPKMLDFYYSKENRFVCPEQGKAVGWSKKILDSLVKMLEENDAQQLAVAGGITFRKGQELLNERGTIIKGIQKGILYQLPGRKTEAFWNSVIMHLVDEIRLNIDRQTSIDISKIVRVPNTIHGGTGLLAKTISAEKLREFNPLDESVVFSENPIKVNVKETPEFYLGGKDWGPFKEGEIEIPEFVAIYLLARGKADAIKL